MKNLFLVAACLASTNFLREEFSADGISGGVDGFSKPNADLMKEIEEEEAKRVRDEQKNAAKNQLQIDTFDQEFEAIRNRRDKAVYNANNKALKLRTEDNAKYLAGGVDTSSHKENLTKITEAKDKEVSDAEKEYRKACDNLRTKNPEGYRRSAYRYSL